MREPPPLATVLALRALSCRNVSRPHPSRDLPSSVAISGREGGAARLAEPETFTASKNSVGHKHLDAAPTTVPRVVLSIVNYYIIFSCLFLGGGARVRVLSKRTMHVNAINVQNISSLSCKPLERKD